MSSRSFSALTMILVFGLLLMPAAVFADHTTDSVHGTVFYDLDQDGLQGPGEVGIPGVTIELYESDVLVASAETGSVGYYEFLDLATGSYAVVELDLTGYASTTPNEVEFSVDDVEIVPAVDFGDVPVAEANTSSIAGTVYNDVDRSRDLSPGDLPLTGSTIYLWDSEGTALGDIPTEADGTFLFEDLSPGSYRLREEDPVDYYSTTPHEVIVTIALAGEAVVEVDFFDFQPEPGELTPVDVPIARFFDLPLLDILDLRAMDGFGYGNIAKVYFLSYLSGMEVSEILTLREGTGWGNVMKEVLGKPGLKGYSLGLIMSGREVPNQVAKIMEGCDLIETQQQLQELMAAGGNQGQIKKYCNDVDTFEDLLDAVLKPDKGKPEDKPEKDNGPPACKGTNKDDPGCE